MTVDKEQLYDLYIVQKKSMKEVSTAMNIAVGTVYNYLNKYKIKTRSRSDYPYSISPEHKEKLRKINTGKVVSKESREKMSQSKTFRGKNKMGHRKQRKDGYIYIYYPDYPSSTKDGYVMEHIYLMEQHIGRLLEKDEVVHHKNHKRNDNRIENLELMTFKQHASLHMRERWEQKKKGGMTY